MKGELTAIIEPAQEGGCWAHVVQVMKTEFAYIVSVNAAGGKVEEI